MTLLAAVAAASTLASFAAVDLPPRSTSLETVDEDTSVTTLWNWSGTHAVQVANQHYWEPETIAEVEAIVRDCHAQGQSVRPIGSALSPNGLGFSADGMLSLAHLDRIVHVDPEQQTVTVQAGARVAHVIEALRPYQLTLPNLASIAEQQMGGFTQVGAHGTGISLAPVDHYVTRLKLVTPGKGTLTLTAEDGELFHLAKVGLGCLGVVVEVTMQCVPAHFLRERTRVLTRQQAKEQVSTLLTQHRHVRYMWIPFTDVVVCVTNDPVDETAESSSSAAPTPSSWFRRASSPPPPAVPNPYTPAERLQPLVDLLRAVAPAGAYPDAATMGFGALRDAILAVRPRDLAHVQRCNRAEAAFWQRCHETTVVRPSDALLQFDCGGQQWVWEVCFPTGTQSQHTGQDMRFMEQLLRGIEEEAMIPAPAPLEQRWSAASSSYMSPAYGPPDGVHSWVGIIQYLPPGATPEQELLQRQEITALFLGPYCDLLRSVGREFDAASHWAKLEPPRSVWQLVDLQLSLARRFPLERFNHWRAELDPKNILASPLMNLLLGKPEPKQ
jgi:L-galactono-1,4-lactone dehydrogenase